jgi:hypothetical protein
MIYPILLAALDESPLLLTELLCRLERRKLIVRCAVFEGYLGVVDRKRLGIQGLAVVV